jgi:hypothetical protein
MQDWLKDDLTERRGRRTIHFHWIENGSAYPIAGQPMPSRAAMDANYQRALLDTDYKALGAIERRFADAIKAGKRTSRRQAAPTCVSGPGIGPPTFRTATRRRPVRRRARCSSTRRIGGFRPAPSASPPLEETVEGVIAFPPSQWGRPSGRGSEAAILERARRRGDPRPSGRGRRRGRNVEAGDAGRAFPREIGLGLNPLLAVPERAPWIPYYGYGAGVVRLSLGDNTELGGKVGAGYVRWNFFTRPDRDGRRPQSGSETVN